MNTPTNTLMTDRGMVAAANMRLWRRSRSLARSIECTCEQGHLVLTGHVASPSQRDAALEAVSILSPSSSVQSRIVIEG